MKKSKNIDSPIMPVYATVSGGGWNSDSLGGFGLSGRSVSEILLSFIDWSIIMIGLIGIIAFIYAGYTYLTAGGEKDKIEQAKKIVVYGIVGVVVSVLGLVAVTTVNNIMGGGKNQTASIPVQSISVLVENSKQKKTSQAILPQSTSAKELETALNNLSEGEIISFSSSDRSGKDAGEIVTFKKEQGKIKLIKIDQKKIQDLIGRKASFNLIPSVFASISAPPGDNCVINSSGDGWDCPDSPIVDATTINSLSIEELRQILSFIIAIIQTRQPVISIIDNPLGTGNGDPIQDPCQSQSTCEEMGGVWGANNNFQTVKVDTGNGTAATSGNCQCTFPDSSPTTINGSEQQNCENSGGRWMDAIDAPMYSYCACPGDSEASKAPHERKTYPKSCNPEPTGNSGTPTTANSKKCLASGGDWIQFANYTVANQAKCDNPSAGVIKLWDPVYDCQCPTGQCVDKDGGCTSEGATDIPKDEKLACTSTGGTWDDRTDVHICLCPTGTFMSNGYCISGEVPGTINKKPGMDKPKTDTGDVNSTNSCKNQTVCESEGGYWINNNMPHYNDGNCRCLFPGDDCLSKRNCEAAGKLWRENSATATTTDPCSCVFGME